jgi:DNA-binding transcriptional ArsR family regulator
VRSRALNDLRLARLKLRKPVRENLPAVLLDLMAACLLIVEEREQFPELGGGHGQQRFRYTDSERERDLRRLEAIALVSMCIFSHLDLVRLRSGKTRRDGTCDAIRQTKPRRLNGRKFFDTKETTIEGETGLSRDRVVRALADLRDAGYMESHRRSKRYENDFTGETRWRSYPAVYTVSLKFIERLGVDLEYFKEEQDKASGREKEKPEAIVDVRQQRAQRRVIRAQRALAAKSARFQREFEERSVAQLERIRQRTEKKQE